MRKILKILRLNKYKVRFKNTQKLGPPLFPFYPPLSHAHCSLLASAVQAGHLVSECIQSQAQYVYTYS